MNEPILVVGAGPVGMTMALELARYGVPVRNIDKNAGRTDKSKALVVWSRTLELLDRAGIAGRFVAAGFKAHGANIIAKDKTIAHITFDRLETPFPFGLMIPQSETERLLEEHLGTLGVKVERETELGSFADEGDRVVAEIRHADGRTETVETPWLIGCDGAHSAVRHGLKMGFEGETQSSDWILGDVHLDGVPGKEDELSIYWNPDGALVLIPIAPGRYRVIADVGEAKEAVLRADPTVAEIQAVLDQRGPGGMQVRDPIWLSAFRINERKVKDYCTGRVFLGGDAAHVHSPAGGQGMNTGMHDACNLAWKLAMVRNGQAKDWLLDNYSEERSEVGRTVLKDASRLTGVAIMRGNVFQAVRNHVAAVVFGLTPVRETMAKKFAELSIGYPHSRLTVGKHGHGLKPRAGERAPVRAGDGVGAGDVARFVLFADSTEEARRLVGKFSELVDGRLREGFSNEGIWLVRPDGYVSVAARAGEWEEMESFLAGLGVEGR